MKDLTYLASPYTHPRAHVRVKRYQQVCIAAGRLLGRGEFVFSPIAHSHPIALVHNLPTDWRFWAEYCRATLGRCSKVAVLMLDGWRESVGVSAEIKLAGELGIAVEYLDPETLKEVPCV
jgi:hypothetical protein